MNRVATQVSALCLCVALSTAPYAFSQKHKRQTDLSRNPLANVNSKQPDKELFDKAMTALRKGRFDVARLDLQTLLNTYPNSEYQMRAKLAIGDTWYKEGGTAALTQAESEYKDFITFFPNTPEAAEAQMKVGDIYFQQMEKPDRDPQNAIHAQQEYRTMLQQFPDSPLVPRAKQRLREVQEVLAQREFEIGEFYATHENWPATLARLQTVVDSYPLFSHSDQALITIGDAYANEAAIAQRLNIPGRAREELVKVYNDRAADAYRQVVTRYAMSPHVEDAKDRLIAMGVPVPEPTQQQLAESEAEEGSRINVRLRDRALLLVKRGPSTVEAARVGEPSLSDPPPITAPEVSNQTVAVFNAAVQGKPLPPLLPVAGPAAGTAATAASGGTGDAAGGGSSGPALELNSVPEGAGTSPGGTDASVEIVSTGNGASAPSTDSGNTAIPGSGAAPAAGTGTPNPANAENPDAVYGLKQPVAPTGNTVLPPVDKPAEAPDQVNDVKRTGGNTAQVTTGTTASGRHHGKKAPYDAGKESSSKHKRKSGLNKLNPF